MTPRILGIRHHGPGCARSVLDALESAPPALVLIEGPPDADELLAQAALEGMKPPVALLLHRQEDARQSVAYPFAEFSPEWQALRWALAHGVPVRFMDLPWQHRFAEKAKIQSPTEADTKDSAPAAPAEPSTAASPASPAASTAPAATQAAPAAESAVQPETEPELDADTQALCRDPLAALARADGYSDSERWWNDRVEERGAAGQIFEGILEAMTALRDELALPESLGERRREAWMRRIIREAQREVLGEIVVVCGAWHAPVLARPRKVSEDNELLKGLPKTKVGATWVPWTHERLSFGNGYGAGITSPGWYLHLWKHRRDPQLTVRWLAGVARLLRRRDLDASTAQIIDAVRLSEHLAALRGRPIPGLDELNEAVVSVFCQGDRTPLRLVGEELIVGKVLGEVPAEVARVPLQQDIEATQRRLRLKPAATQTDLELDLREATHLEKSLFLNRLAVLDVPWGKTTAAAARTKGTFKETWRLEWKAEFAMAIIDAARFGNTVEGAATGALTQKASTADLEGLCTLLHAGLLADLPAASRTLLSRIDAEAARGDDVLRLARAVPALAQLARYGNVRQTETADVARILDGLCARVHAGVQGAVAGIDDDSAAEWREAFKAHQASLLLLESERIAEWHAVLGRLQRSETIHSLLAGTATRLLFEASCLDAAETARLLGLALSRGAEPLHAAGWIEGFLGGQGSLLVHDENLLPLLETWVGGLAEESFMNVLPLLRRTFSAFTAPERARIAGRLGKAQARTGGPSNAGSAETWLLDEARANSVLPALCMLLGLQNAEPARPAAASDALSSNPSPINPLSP